MKAHIKLYLTELIVPEVQYVPLWLPGLVFGSFMAKITGISGGAMVAQTRGGNKSLRKWSSISPKMSVFLNLKYTSILNISIMYYLCHNQ